MSDSSESQSWYRIASMKPRLKSHAEIHRQRFRGELWYVLEDHASGRFHRFTPAANQIIGFPSEDFDSLRDDMDGWKKLGIVVKPFFATPYPGSEWFWTYRSEIERQYDGDLEKFVLSLGDATRITAVISHNFNAVELLGLRELMLNFDYQQIAEYERIWRANHRVPDTRPSTLYTDPAGREAAE
ncbi:MAG: hypothetical protein IH998_17780 [Proteobacteria bacterium]|nr:hypothetical protein [Pseudomonadota bacterium]